MGNEWAFGDINEESYTVKLSRISSLEGFNNHLFIFFQGPLELLSIYYVQLKTDLSNKPLKGLGGRSQLQQHVYSSISSR